MTRVDVLLASLVPLDVPEMTLPPHAAVTLAAIAAPRAMRRNGSTAGRVNADALQKGQAVSLALTWREHAAQTTNPMRQVYARRERTACRAVRSDG